MSDTAAEPSGTAAAPSGTVTEPSGTAAERIGTVTEPSGTAAERIGTVAEPSDTATDAVEAGGLTDEQRAAVARRGGSLLLSAGAGSGKTSVLVERFVAAVLEDGIAPTRILAISFTDRAAGELRQRIKARLLALDARGRARELEAAFVCTFHAFCARLLRAHPLLASVQPDFEILDERLAGRMRELAFATALQDFLAAGGEEAVDLVAAYTPSRLRVTLQELHAQLRSRGERTPRLALTALDPAAQGARECRLIDELLAAFDRRYEERKSARGALDFDDLELYARDLLEEHESVRADWSRRFELVMVDEFQDTNARQLAILTALERDNVFTVGDERQSIYSFRHADVSLFRARRTQLQARDASLALTRNFRSREPLLDVVNAVFAQRFEDDYAPLVAARGDERAHGREGTAARARDEPLVELLLTDKHGCDGAQLAGGDGWRQAEARLLAERVAELVREGRARQGDIAILLRAIADMSVYERALQERGLSTLASVGDFWERQEVLDLLTYLRALSNPHDEAALYGALASPLAGACSDGLALLARAAAATGESAWETLGRLRSDHADGRLCPDGEGPSAERDAILRRLSDGDRRALLSLYDVLAAERETRHARTISALIERVMAQSGYREHVLGLPWGRRRLANVHKLLALTRRFQASEGRDLRGFLDFAARQAAERGGAEPDAPVAGAEPDAVSLMTVHAAKGLEFAVVCVADLGRMQNLGVADVLVDGERVGLRLARLDGAPAVPALDFQALCERSRHEQAQEEDRVLYVAMTRARERLLLSGAVDFERWPQPRLGAPAISWLGPALCAQLPAIVKARERAVCDLAVGANGTSVRLRTHAPGPSDAAPAAATAQSAQSRSEGAERQAARRLPTHSAHPGPAQHPIATLSYTALTELERCGYRYYLERVLGLPEARPATRRSGGRLPARARGTLVHKLLESLDYARPVRPSQGDVAAVARELRLRVGADERREIAELVGAALTALIDGDTQGAPSALRGAPAGERGLAPSARVAAAKSVHREYPFALSLAGEQPLLTGVIDLLARERGEQALVLDYKSDRVADDEDLDALVEREYGAQRDIYALAVLRAGGCEAVEIVHWFLQRPQAWVTARYAREQVGRLEERLAERIERARARQFAVSEHPRRSLCETCPGRASLCCYGQQRTLGE